ncbi:DUF6776 family protein [Luteimonas sp. SDU82]|uniref:DUF6776 family protein n=1 Tax=Luteimonas sp. SDU82 TaxID=3422592 RepID=UPI003EBD96D0
MSDDAPRPPADGATPAPAVPAHIQGASYAVLAVFVAAIAFGLWGIWQVLMGPGPRPGSGQAQIEALAQQVATLTRSDQISREANRDLQGTLAERDEEIAALRADVAFYERFVGSTAQRRGLTVHELVLTPRSDQAWHYTVTLTQNLNRGAVSSGRLSLSLEGTRDGRLEQLDWDALRQDPEATGVEYSFKYFQQVEGEIVLPPGFAPLRIRVRLAPASGAPIEQTLPWDEVARAAAR